MRTQMKKWAALFLAVIMLSSILTACGTENSTTASTTTDSEQQQDVSENSNDTEVSPTASAAEEENGIKAVTDMAGRQVEIPTQINSVYCSVPTAEAMVCTLLPDLMNGWVNELSDESAQFLPESLKNLPVLGGWMGQQVTANYEDIIKAAPDVIIYMTDNLASKMDIPEEIQSQTGIPVLVVPSELDQTATVYRWLGEVLGVAERGEALATYCEEKMAAVADAVAAIPEEERYSIYYAEKADGLSTEPTGSQHVAVLDFLQLKNVAADVELKSGQGFTEVSMETVLNWDPDIILATADSYEEVTTSDVWAPLRAVQNGNVYYSPRYPFNWIDRPPNIMRVLGIQWLASAIYPEYVDIDIEQEVRDFFELFYRVDLTDDQVSLLLAEEYNP